MKEQSNKSVTSKLYLKVGQSVSVSDCNVNLEDIIKIYSSDKDLEYAVRKIKILKFNKAKKDKAVISILKIIEQIQNEFPNITIETIGETDTIVYYKAEQKESMIWFISKVVFVSLVAFVGGGYSIMSYNNDVSSVETFKLLSQTFTGSEDSVLLIEIFYAIGLVIGVMIFFNHAANKKFSEDPSPLQVQMRQYEKDVNSTFIIGSERKEEKIDVD